MGGSTQNVQKPPPGKNVQKSQGQIPKVKWENKKWETGKNRFKPEKTGKMGK